MSDPREFIDRNGGYQSERTGVAKEAHDAWVATNTWGLTRDDFIRLSYFHGDLESGSDGSGPVNGSEDRPGDVVYIAANGSSLTRSMVSSWLSDYGSFIHGYSKCHAARLASAPSASWLPIETAPKDGTWILLWWGEKSHFAHWLDNSKTATPWAGWRVPSLMTCPVGQKPTHWMPLPAAPKVEGATP